MKFTPILVLPFLIAFAACAQPKTAFQVVPLGVKGGSDESNLSAYAIALKGTNEYVCLDAGTLHAGIEKAVLNKTWQGTADEILKNNIKGYLISHPHLDHVAGLIINAPDDSAKPIYGLPGCIDVLKTNYFTWKSWANFTNEGDKPTLNKYTYTILIPGTSVPLSNTTMRVTAFPLSHVNPYESTAFLLQHNEDYLLYLGDTGSDEIEKSDKLLALWRTVSPLIKEKKLKAIFIEVSFPNSQADNLLFGHLTPRLLLKEMNVLSQQAGNSGLANVPIVITHRKPVGNNEEIIKKELTQVNNLNLNFIYPEQGKSLEF
jgi:cAMP phosphodiesterase